MLRKLKATSRIIILTGVLFAIAIGIIFSFLITLNKSKEYSIEQVQDIMFQGQKEKLKTATHSLALGISNQLKKIKDKSEHIVLIRESVSDIRFENDKSGYFFVYEGTVNIALPAKKELQGKNLEEKVDENGIYYVQKMYQQARSGGGFVSYVFPKPGKGNVKKVSYSEMIPGTNYWIGSGVYLDNIEDKKAIIESVIDNLAREQHIKISIIILILIISFIIPVSIAIRNNILLKKIIQEKNFPKDN